MWRGEPLFGAYILQHAEQGLGDTLQFVRYVPLVAARGGKVVLEIPADLYGLLSGIDGAAEVVVRGDSLPNFAWHCPLLSLPLAFSTDLATIPANVPYVHAEPAAAHSWSQRLAGATGLRVGLVWAGNPVHTRDPQRSVALSKLTPLLQIPGATFYSLQKGPAALQLRELPEEFQLIDLSSHLTSFSDSAALLSSLDLLIAVDTAAVHLAGALGRPGMDPADPHAGLALAAGS